VGVTFFCVCFSIHIRNFFVRFKNPDRNIRKPTEKLLYFSVRVNTDRKIDIILSVFSKLTEKLRTRTEKLYTRKKT